VKRYFNSAYVLHLEKKIKKISNSQNVLQLHQFTWLFCDAKYEKASVDATMDLHKHFSGMQQQQLKVLLHKLDHLFDGHLANGRQMQKAFK
jgi:hypothetical protein